MHKKNAVMREAAGLEYVITRVFDAPRALVFSAWTDPARLARWWGPHAFTTPVCEADARPGGAYRIVLRSPEGEDYPIAGVYREVAAPERLVFSQNVDEHPAEWHDFLNAKLGLKKGGKPVRNVVATAVFESRGGKTKLTVRTRFESPAVRDALVKMGMNEGWSQSLERLATLLKEGDAGAREIVTTRVIDAPRERVFEAWTDPRRAARWWGPDGFTNTIKRMDVRPGGVWEFVMHGPDGTDYRNKIEYVEVVEPSRLIYEHVSGPRFRASVTFDDWRGKTRVVMRMVFETAAERDATVRAFDAVEGAKQTLARLAEHLAGKV